MESTSTVITVNTVDELMAELKAAKGGEIIEVGPGNYGELNINVPYGDPWGAFAGEVTIRSADPDNPAAFSEIYMRGVENLTFDGILLDFTSADGLATGEVDRQQGITVRESANITIRNSVIEGDTYDDPGEAISGLAVGKGLVVRDSQAITVENNEFLSWARAATFAQTSELVVQENNIHSIRSDGLDFADVDQVLIQGNYIHDFISNHSTTDHRDMIQFWTRGTTSPSTDVVIRDNIMDSGTGIDTHSIFMRNEDVDSYGGGKEMFYQNITIENNTIYNSHLHGITVGETAGLLIKNNTLLHNADTGTGSLVYIPIIKIAEASSDVTILNNIAAGVTEIPEGASNWRVENNLIVQDTSPDEPNFYEHLFINALVGGDEADLAAIQALPGGIVEQGGYGSLLTRYDPTPDELTAIVRTEGRTGEAFAFNGIFSANPQGRVGADDATFQWDMGDGTSLQGIGVSHTYSTPGTYTVKLTVKHEDGSVDTAFTQAYVQEPVRLSLDTTEAGLVDRSTYEVATPSDLEIVLDGGRYATRVSDTAGFELPAPVHDLDAFTISLDLRALDGTGSAGEMFRLFPSMLLTVGEDGSFNFDFTNAEDNSFRLQTGATSALDGGWHNLDLTYGASSGALRLYLDGEEIGRTAASGSTHPEEYWDLNFGSSHKPGFDGLIDDIRIRDEEASALEIRDDRSGIDAPLPDPVPGVDADLPGETDSALISFDPSAQVAGLDFRGNAAISADGTVLLDGHGDYISMSPEARPDFTGAVSVAFDLRFSEAPSDSEPVRVLWQHLEFGLQLSDGRLSAAVVTADGDVEFSAGVEHELFDGAWHRLSLSIDSEADILSLYADGEVLIERTDLDIELSDSSRALTFGSAGWHGSMAGELDDIVVGNVAMERPNPVSEVQTDLAGIVNADPDPVQEPEIPDGSGFTTMDFGPSSETPDLRFHGDAAVSAEGTALLDGHGDYVSMGSEARPDFTGAVSVAFDLRFSEAPSDSEPVRVLWQHLEFGLQLSDGRLSAAVGTADGGMEFSTGIEHELFDGAWHRLSLSIDSEADTLSLYADGDLLIERTDLDIELSDSSRALTFGSAGWHGSMAGELDDIVVGNAGMETLMAGSDAWTL